MVSSWNPNLPPISYNILHAGIENEVRSKDLGKVLQIYRSYGENEPFWERRELSMEIILLWGGLNLSFNPKRDIGIGDMLGSSCWIL